MRAQDAEDQAADLAIPLRMLGYIIAKLREYDAEENAE